jgi:hypothetical protein
VSDVVLVLHADAFIRPNAKYAGHLTFGKRERADLPGRWDSKKEISRLRWLSRAEDEKREK